ncbi:MAG: nicotinamide riboside transporter PnuC [Firmicutes bacterium]|nr:nicotinamide riboside transporter PnuC [[Eubacterium] siraeum]MCM1488409.1 nicotinamide riboside transporter PnuC [Bacillota bacterium]
MLKRLRNYFTESEIILWFSSAALIVISFFIFGGDNVLTLVASVIGVTSLLLCAKGNPLGQILIIVFSVLYGIVSYSSAYYGEMVTYLGMTAPMAVISLVAWLKNPYKGNKAEVKVSRLRKGEIPVLLLLTAAVTVLFYFILRFFGTANLAPSTLSVTTSFIAVYLTFRRSAFFAAAYAANDIVLIILWVMAAINDISYLSVVICFVVFLANDIYGFISWLKRRKEQEI